MKSLIKIIILTIITLFAAIPCYSMHSFSNETDFSEAHSSFVMSISVQSGLLYGVTEEHIYSKGNEISKLDWDLKSLYYIGLTFNTQIYKKFFLNIGYWGGVNKDLGTISDHDYSSDETLSNFSKHDCVLQNAQFFDLNLTYYHPVLNWLTMSGLIGYSGMTIKMIAHNGYLQYPPGSKSVPFYGTGISNEQIFNIPYIGLGTTLTLPADMYIQGYAMYSFLVFCNQTDYHLRREIEVYTTMQLGQYISLNATVGCKINDFTAIVVSYNHTDITTTRGSSYIIDLNSGEKSTPSAGTGGVHSYFHGITLSVDHLMRWL